MDKRIDALFAKDGRPSLGYFVLYDLYPVLSIDRVAGVITLVDVDEQGLIALAYEELDNAKFTTFVEFDWVGQHD